MLCIIQNSSFRSLTNQCMSYQGHSCQKFFFYFNDIQGQLKEIIKRKQNPVWNQTYWLEWTFWNYIFRGWGDKKYTDKLLFYNYFKPNFRHLHLHIFHKTEVQTVILRRWMGLYLNWVKSYDTKCNFFHFRFIAIL